MQNNVIEREMAITKRSMFVFGAYLTLNSRAKCHRETKELPVDVTLLEEDRSKQMPSEALEMV